MIGIFAKIEDRSRTYELNGFNLISDMAVLFQEKQFGYFGRHRMESAGIGDIKQGIILQVISPHGLCQLSFLCGS